MGISMKAEWDGYKEWQESERQWSQKVVEMTISEVERTALRIERDSKLLVPVDTGNLRASLKAEINKTKSSIKTETGTDEIYAGVVEFGGLRHTPQPYLIPSYNRNVGELEKTLKNVLGG